jgi:hypothetical protein
MEAECISQTFHEMGTNTTYFFQPGVPERTHPLTPQLNQDLTMAIAEYHAEALDEIQRAYIIHEKGLMISITAKDQPIRILTDLLESCLNRQVHAAMPRRVYTVLKTFPYTILNQVSHKSLSTFRGSLELKRGAAMNI